MTLDELDELVGAELNATKARQLFPSASAEERQVAIGLWRAWQELRTVAEFAEAIGEDENPAAFEHEDALEGMPATVAQVLLAWVSAMRDHDDAE